MNLRQSSRRSRSKDIVDLLTLNDVECDSPIGKAITNVAANNSSFCVLIIGIFATIAIICASLAISTSALSSLIINSDRHLLSSSSGNNTDSNSITSPDPETPTRSSSALSMISLFSFNDTESNSTTMPDPTTPIATSPTNSLSTDNWEYLSLASSRNDTETSLISIEKLLAQAPENSTEDMVLGALLGSAIADALGMVLEFHFGAGKLYKDSQGKLVGKKVGNEFFQTWTEVVDNGTTTKVKYPGRHTEYIRAVDVAMTMSGEGIFRAPPGMSSDDTAMAIQMARGFIATSEGLQPNETHSVDIKDIQQNIFEQYFKWANPNRNGSLAPNGLPIRNQPFDIGDTIKKIYITTGTLDVATVLNKTKAENENSYEKYGSGLWSNGALMRLAPMPVYCMHLSQPDVFKVVEADVELTNNNPFVATAATTYVLMMREMIKGGSPQDAFTTAVAFLEEQEPIDLPDGVAKHEVNGTMVTKKEKPSTVILRWIDEITKKDAEQPECCDKAPEFTITTGFKQGIWYLNAWATNGINKPSYTDIMRQILLGKGDTDTNAAIVGSMLGAALGIHGIHNEPNGHHWLETLLSCSVKPYPRRINAKSQEQNETDPDHNPYLAKVYVTENIWQELIQIAPKFITGISSL